MAMITSIDLPVNTNADPESWEPDSDRWELGPLEEDIEWAREALNTDADDYDVEDPKLGAEYDAYLDSLAAESAAQDRLEGLIPADVADYISVTGLVGHYA